MLCRSCRRCFVIIVKLIKKKTRYVKDIIEGYPWLAQIVIFLDIFQTEIIPLHVHPQVIYYNCVRVSSLLVHPFRRICANKTFAQRNKQINGQGNSYKHPKTFLRCIINILKI